MTEPRQRPDPIKPQFLDYRDRTADKSKMSGGEIAAGFGSWVVAVFAGFAVGNATQVLGVGIFVFLAAIAASTIYFFGQRRYRGFIPGLLIGAALTCLLPLGIVAAICWSK